MKNYREQGVPSPDKADNHIANGQQPQMVIIQQSPHNQQQQMQHVQMQIMSQPGEMA